MRLAMDLGKTRHELLPGESAPLSNDEYVLWLAWYQLEAEDAEKAAKKAQKN